MDPEEGHDSDSLNLDESRDHFMGRDEMVSFHKMDRIVYRGNLFSHYQDDNPLPHPSNSAQLAQRREMSMPQQMETSLFADTPSSQTSPKKQNKHKRISHPREYEKNICGYITKKVIRQFVGNAYNSEIAQLAQKYGASLEQCKAYYQKKIQIVTGPSHLPALFSLQIGESSSMAKCKGVFGEFYKWFLKHRYLRYLLNEGKMTNKQAYIDYKNKKLFKFVEQHQESPQQRQNSHHFEQIKREQIESNFVKKEQS